MYVVNHHLHAVDCIPYRRKFLGNKSFAVFTDLPLSMKSLNRKIKNIGVVMPFSYISTKIESLKLHFCYMHKNFAP